MSRLSPSAERLVRARQLIQQARDFPVPVENGRNNFSYIAQVKDLLRQARDLIKFIPLSPTTTDLMRDEVKSIFHEADQANEDLLH